MLFVLYSGLACLCMFIFVHAAVGNHEHTYPHNNMFLVSEPLLGGQRNKGDENVIVQLMTPK